jgi:hypothetical protein
MQVRARAGRVVCIGASRGEGVGYSSLCAEHVVTGHVVGMVLRPPMVVSVARCAPATSGVPSAAGSGVPWQGCFVSFGVSAVPPRQHAMPTRLHHHP